MIWRPRSASCGQILPAVARSCQECITLAMKGERIPPASLHYHSSVLCITPQQRQARYALVSALYPESVLSPHTVGCHCKKEVSAPVILSTGCLGTHVLCYLASVLPMTCYTPLLVIHCGTSVRFHASITATLAPLAAARCA